MGMFDNSLRRQEIEDEEIQRCLQNLMVMMVKLEILPLPIGVQRVLSQYRDDYCETVKTPRISGARDNGSKKRSSASQLALQNAADRLVSADRKAYSALSKKVSEK